MKNLIIATVAIALCACAGNVYADQPGTISQDVMAELGLGGVQTMTDEEGLEVRGMGLAQVGGFITINAGPIFVHEWKAATSLRNNAYAEGGFQAVVTFDYGCFRNMTVSVAEMGYAIAR